MEGLLTVNGRLGSFARHPLLLIVCLLALTPSIRGQDADEPAKLKISGYGIFGNRELKALIKSLQTGAEEPHTFDSTFIEDAVLVLFSRIARDGYLAPTMHARITRENGEVLEKTWTEPLADPLPRDLQARRVEIEIDEGVLFYFENIQFRGLDELPVDDAAHFFIETDALIKLKRNRIYSPDRFANSLKNLQEALEREGFQSATVTATNLVIQTNTGAVTADILVDEGLRTYVRSIQIEPGTNATEVLSRPLQIQTNVVFNQMWLQDFAQELRRQYFEQGYADARVEVSQPTREEVTNSVQIDLVAAIEPGKKIEVGNVLFEGHEKTKEGLMRQRIKLDEGDLLNPIIAERGRYRLARLGIFDTVELRYDEVDEDTRNVVYSLNEGKRFDFSILAGSNRSRCPGSSSSPRN